MFGRCREAIWRSRAGRSIDIGVDGQGASDLSAEQHVGRHLECLACEVPHRLLDRTECGSGDEPFTCQRLATLSIELDLERRASVDQRKESLELIAHPRSVADGCVGEAECIGRFAEADEACVGEETNEQPHRS